MTTQSVFEELTRILRDVAEAAREEGGVVPPTPTLEPESSATLRIQDLGLDSLSSVALVAGVEDRFGIELSPTILLDCHTVGDFVRSIQSRARGDSRA